MYETDSIKLYFLSYIRFSKCIGEGHEFQEEKL